MARPTRREKAMTLSRVEHALGMMRIYLVECAAQNDWGDARSEELAQTIVACIRQTADQGGQKAPERDPRLARDVLRHAIRFVNENLDTKLKWDDIALEVGCSCQSHLTTLFRKHLGTTPGAFRGSARKRQQRVPHLNSAIAGIDLTQVSMRGPRAAFAAT